MFEKWAKENVLTTKTPLQYCGIALRELTLISFCCLLLFFVVFIFLRSIVVLTQNWQFFSCAGIAFSERYTCNGIIN